MIANPDHARIKAAAAYMLNTRQDTPDGKVKLFNDMLPLAEFANGLHTPNSHPPNAVYVELDGVLWRLMRGDNKRWQRA